MSEKIKQTTLYDHSPNLIIGFHGCDRSTYNNVLHNNGFLKPSVNNYDWLGNGIYFWEQNLTRAWEWAESSKKIKHPAVIGAVIDLGNCLNLLDGKFIKMLKSQYELFASERLLYGDAIPVNKDVKGNTDLLLRYLDCTIIERLHQARKKEDEVPFDSTRGVFFEGNRIYNTSGFYEQSHIQICVRNPNCIKGFFAPMRNDPDWDVP